MSWVDQSGYDMKIITGNGEEFNVLWMRAVRTKEFNIAEFNFPGVSGTLVSRGTPKGRRYNLEIYFQGDDHLDRAGIFDLAADDPRPWQILHPYYGTLFVQPISLDYDNMGHNVTKVTGTVVETIMEDKPKVSVDPPDQIVNLATSVYEFSTVAVTSKMKPFTVKDVNSLKKNTFNIYSVGKKSIFDTVTFDSYFNAFNTANTLVSNATKNPLDAIRAVQAMLNAPHQFADSVKSRITILVEQFDLLATTILNLNSRTGKRLYENNAVNILSGLTLTSITNYNYRNRNEVLEVIGSITDTYNKLIVNLDGLQTESGEEESYHPDIETMQALSALVNFTISNLFNVAVDAKQQRSVILDEDTNAILLTHRFYGMTATDIELQRFIDDNEIGLSELLQIRKGRRVIYYL